MDNDDMYDHVQKNYLLEAERALHSAFKFAQLCLLCGHQDNADHDAAIVIRKRAINLILHSGTELVGASKNVLQPRANASPRKALAANAVKVIGCLSKKKVTAKQSLEARLL